MISWEQIYHHFSVSSIVKWVIILTLTFYAGFSIPNAGAYYTIQQLDVKSTTININEPIELQVERQINSDFRGEYVVTIRQFSENGNGWLTYCNGSDTADYRTSAVLPDPVTLKWWIGVTEKDDCAQGVISEPGTYKIETCWRIHRDFTFPLQVCAKTNNFKVVEKE